jgi:prolyl-tRNA synthetase
VNKKIEYNKILLESGLFFSGPSKGSFILPPNGLILWQNIQNILNQKFAKYDVKNVSLPTLIPYSFFQKEKQHIQGFSPEFFQIQKIGKKELSDPLVLRPTSEVLFYDWFRQTLRNYQQLPFLYNQWCQVFRAEKNTKPFLRNTEFFWQEGHTLHETKQEAQEFAQKIWQEYQEYAEKFLCLAVITGKKSKKEKFAGAVESYTVECLLPDGQCLQLATSHYFGDEFCRSMNVRFQGRDNQFDHHPFSTSWGTSTRAIGALVLSHVDNLGLILPFDIAPVQIAFILIREDEDLINYYQEMLNILVPAKFRCRLYSSALQADKEGCPLKIIIGPAELKKKKITLKKRDDIKKEIIIGMQDDELEKKLFPICEDYMKKINKTILEKNKKNEEKSLANINLEEKAMEAMKNGLKQGKIFKAVTQVKKELNENLYQKSVNFRDQHIFPVKEYQELEKKINEKKVGLFLIPFCDNLDCEETIPHKLPSYSIRCISLSEEPKEEAKCIFCIASTKNYAYLGRSY